MAIKQCEYYQISNILKIRIDKDSISTKMIP